MSDEEARTVADKILMALHAFQVRRGYAATSVRIGTAGLTRADLAAIPHLGVTVVI